MLFNMVPKLVAYFKFNEIQKDPIYHVGYINGNMLFIVSSVCALRKYSRKDSWSFHHLILFVLVAQGTNKGNFIVHAAVSNVHHNRNHEQLGQFYVSIRE